MDKEYVYDLIKEWNSDSKSISGEAEKELIGHIKLVISRIHNILNLFGRSYDPKYPSLNIGDKKFDKDCFIIPSAFRVKIDHIDDDYIYMYYDFSRKMELSPTKLPIETLIYFSDDLNVEEFKLRVIDAEKTHLLNDLEFKKQALKDAEIKYEKFCEKYFQNN